MTYAEGSKQVRGRQLPELDLELLLGHRHPLSVRVTHKCVMIRIQDGGEVGPAEGRVRVDVEEVAEVDARVANAHHLGIIEAAKLKLRLFVLHNTQIAFTFFIYRRLTV